MNEELDRVEILCHGSPVFVLREKLDEFLARPAYTLPPEPTEEPEKDPQDDLEDSNENPEDNQELNPEDEQEPEVED
jgi:hypothetical protein